MLPSIRRCTLYSSPAKIGCTCTGSVNRLTDRSDIHRKNYFENEIQKRTHVSLKTYEFRRNASPIHVKLVANRLVNVIRSFIAKEWTSTMRACVTNYLRKQLLQLVNK